jgi:hydrogenase maturation protease
LTADTGLPNPVSAVILRSIFLKTLVIGLGNPILSDDGIGVRIAEEVLNHLPVDTQIDVTEVSVGGLTLMETMISYDMVILIDAIQLDNPHPGMIHRMSLAELREISPTQHSTSPHDTSLITALEMGQRIGLDLPEEIIIYAIEVENVLDFGEELTPAVAAAIPKATVAVLGDLKSNHI